LSSYSEMTGGRPHAKPWRGNEALILRGIPPRPHPLEGFE